MGTLFIPLYTTVRINHSSKNTRKGDEWDDDDGGDDGVTEDDNATDDISFYRADPVVVDNVRKEASVRSDWGFFRWDYGSEKKQLYQDIPGRILCFLAATPCSAVFFGKQYKPGRIFALVQSLTKEPQGYYDLSKEREEDGIQHPASKLIFRGIMETDNLTPRATLTPLDTLNGPAIVVKDFDPVFKNRKGNITSMLKPFDSLHEHMVIRNRRQWSQVFQALCRKKLNKRPLHSPKYQNVFAK